MDVYNQIKKELMEKPRTWLVTGAAGFIGSNLVETLLNLNQKVIGLDNFATGFQRNLDEVKTVVGEKPWANFNFIEGDIRNLDDCIAASKGVDYILHNAALGSVPRSIENPANTNATNINGFLNMLLAGIETGVKNFVYAGSSSTYGDHSALPKIEDRIGKPMSPYAVTKYVNELYADVFFKIYGLNTIGLRYFNVFGKRQNSQGAYAAVIPKWVSSMILNEDIYINGLGDTSRDFCFIENIIQANILAATTSNLLALNQVYNVACYRKTSLLQLFEHLKELLANNGVVYHKEPIHRDTRAGDVKHSLAAIDKIQQLLGYNPQVDFKQNLARVMPWYVNFFNETVR